MFKSRNETEKMNKKHRKKASSSPFYFIKRPNSGKTPTLRIKIKIGSAEAVPFLF